VAPKYDSGKSEVAAPSTDRSVAARAAQADCLEMDPVHPIAGGGHWTDFCGELLVERRKVRDTVLSAETYYCRLVLGPH